MRIIVFFDLPVTTAPQRRQATSFRNFLLKDGYHMVQFSVYCRVCNGYAAVEKHRQRIYHRIPDNGSVRLLVITEKQYQTMEILLGARKKEDDPIEYEQLSIF